MKSVVLESISPGCVAQGTALSDGVYPWKVCMRRLNGVQPDSDRHTFRHTLHLLFERAESSHKSKWVGRAQQHHSTAPPRTVWATKSGTLSRVSFSLYLHRREAPWKKRGRGGEPEAGLFLPQPSHAHRPPYNNGHGSELPPMLMRTGSGLTASTEPPKITGSFCMARN